MILQPPSTPPTVWELSYYENYVESLIWMAAIIAIIFGILTLVDYFNTRRRSQLVWSLSFFSVWIVFHQLIMDGDYSMLLGAVIATISALIPGLLAAGLFYALFEDKKILKLRLGDIYLLFVVVMASVILIVKADPTTFTPMTPSALPAWLTPVVVMVLHIPSGLSIILLPILKNRAQKSSYIMSIGGIAISIVGILLAIISLDIMATDEYLALVFTLFPWFLLLSVGSFAFGILLPEKWRFSIPNVEFEER